MDNPRVFTNITKAQLARTEKALDTKVRVNGGAVITRRALIEQRVKEGAKVVLNRRGERVLESPNGAFFDQANITKAGLDYAESIQDNPAFCR